MPFMQPQVLHCLVVTLELVDGSSCSLPADVLGLTTEQEQTETTPTQDEAWVDYLPDEPVSYEVRQQFIGRLSAPGFMDCTDWVAGTWEEVREHLVEYDWYWCDHCNCWYDFEQDGPSIKYEHQIDDNGIVKPVKED